MSKKLTKKYSKTSKLASRLLVAGLVLILISMVINYIYIRPTNFKQQFKQKQYEECIANGNATDICEQNFK